MSSEELTQEQIANWRKWPEFATAPEDVIRRFHRRLQAKIDRLDSCDAFIDGTRCGEPEANHRTDSQRHNYLNHPFMEPPSNE